MTQLSYSDDFLGYLAVESVSGLEQFTNNELAQADLGFLIASHVCSSIRKLPWTYRLPVTFLGAFFQTLCFVLNLRRMSRIPVDRRARFTKLISHLPLFGLLWKLVRTTAIMRLFDSNASIIAHAEVGSQQGPA